MLEEGKLSDLYFSHTHDEYDTLDFTIATEEDIAAAIIKDAEDFVESFPELGQDAKWYAHDFKNRI